MWCYYCYGYQLDVFLQRTCGWLLRDEVDRTENDGKNHSAT